MTLLDHLARVPDPRRPQGRRYPLPPLLAGAIMAMLCGHAGYRPIARFLAVNAGDLRRHAGWPDRPPPSNVTVRAVLRALDFAALSAEFRAWAAERLPDGEVLAPDAKAVRSTVADHDGPGQDFVALVGAYGALSGLTAAAGAHRHKTESEADAARDLIAELAAGPDLSGGDGDAGRVALRKKTLAAIADAGGDWLVKARETGPPCRRPAGEPPRAKRSRPTSRRSETAAGRSGVREGRAFRREGFYLTSRTGDAAALADVIRGRWPVENRLHWCKDVSLNEDRGRVRDGSGAAVLSLLRGQALSLLRHAGLHSPVDAFARLANRVPDLLRLLRT